MLFLRFWRSALAWTAAMVALGLASAVFSNFAGPYSHHPAVLLALFGGTLGQAALYLPVAALPAGIRVGRDSPARNGRVQLLLTLASLAAATFLLHAYAGPWLQSAGLAAFARGAGADVAPGPPLTRPLLHSLYLELAAEDRGGPAPFNGLAMGLRYHLQVTAGALAAAMALLGMWIGRWTEGVGDRMRRAVQRWLAGLGLAAGVYASYRLGGRLTLEAGVDPVLTACTVLVVPGVVLLAAAWAQWVAGSRPAPEPR
jgi:hypothetical protein